MVISGAGKIANPVLQYYDDIISNIVLEPYDAETEGAVTVFLELGCQGRSARLKYEDPVSASTVSGEFSYFSADIVKDLGVTERRSFAVA